MSARHRRAPRKVLRRRCSAAATAATLACLGVTGAIRLQVASAERVRYPPFPMMKGVKRMGQKHCQYCWCLPCRRCRLGYCVEDWCLGSTANTRRYRRIIRQPARSSDSWLCQRSVLPWGAHPADHQEPARKVMRRPIAALLHVELTRQCHIWRRRMSSLIQLQPTHTYTNNPQIIFHSQEKQYIMTNLPWLIGSLGTMVEDVTIFIQFRVFGNGEASSALEA